MWDKCSFNSRVESWGRIDGRIFLRIVGRIFCRIVSRAQAPNMATTESSN